MSDEINKGLKEQSEKPRFEFNLQFCTDFLWKYYLLELIHLQRSFNEQLIINQYLQDQYIKNRGIGKQKNSPSDTSTNRSNQSNKEEIGIQKFVPNPRRNSDKKSKNNPKKRKSDSEYEPDESQDHNEGHYQFSQTKNVPKNFGKSILGFINKNSIYINRVLKRFGIEAEKFCKYVQKFKGKIFTIADLRSLWVQEDNCYAQILRIISAEYMRKYNLSHVFNSRIQNHSNYVKYRYKIMSALEDPKNFTQIKDF